MISDFLFLQMATAHGKCDDHAKVSIGAIIDYSSRIGKEEKVAMEIAMEDFNSRYPNLHIDLLINSSHGEPIQAALAGKSMIRSSP